MTKITQKGIALREAKLDAIEALDAIDLAQDEITFALDGQADKDKRDALLLRADEIQTDRRHGRYSAAVAAYLRCEAATYQES